MAHERGEVGERESDDEEGQQRDDGAPGESGAGGETEVAPQREHDQDLEAVDRRADQRHRNLRAVVKPAHQGAATM